MRRDLLRDLYFKISEPRAVRLLYALIYMCLAGAGLTVALEHPITFTASLDGIITLICGAFTGIGGLLGAGFVLTRLWAWERVGTVLVTTGLLSYMVAALYTQFATDLSGNRLPTVFLLAALVTAMIMRWVTIRKTVLYPTD